MCNSACWLIKHKIDILATVRTKRYSCRGWDIGDQPAVVDDSNFSQHIEQMHIASNKPDEFDQ